VNGQARHERIHGHLLIRLSAIHTGWPIEEADHPHIRHWQISTTMRYVSPSSTFIEDAYRKAVSAVLADLEEPLL